MIAKILKYIKDEIKLKISEEVNLAVQYSILMDTTIDVSTLDQCAFVLRYVRDSEVTERLLALKSVVSTSGQSLFETLKTVLEETNIPLENCVANAFDGASNMSGQYNGVTAKLCSVIPNHIHTWCYAHVLNLVLTDTAQCINKSINFFNLLQEVHVFMNESIKRLQKFIEENPSFKLEAIGQTRWRSRSNATVKIFGRIDDWDGEVKSKPPKLVYLELVIALFKISTSQDFNSKVRSDSDALLKKLLSFECILVAMLFLQVFKVTTPLSDYLQTKDLDFVQAWRFIENSHRKLTDLREKFPDTVKAANNFVAKMNENLEEREKEDESLSNIYIETSLKETRRRKLKKLPGEEANDEIVGSSPEDKFRIEIFIRIVDTLIHTMENRFLVHKQLYLDLAWFDPKRFDAKEKIPPNALDKITEILPGLDRSKLKEELCSFSELWPKICEKDIGPEYSQSKEEAKEKAEVIDSDIEQVNDKEEEDEEEEGEEEVTCKV
ncbi:uncharacterized protein LOC128984050 [Macrosteles quadrilineatus]|uniref:uncharacterized protein LOC128984050 n=1 Tax=Macrosteles quadrilineatus TaxID=74068 RepID=UPI0023E2C5C5|nr:uncharacterized protein LOC128984050 [Macrosteles quadrilineatus]